MSEIMQEKIYIESQTVLSFIITRIYIFLVIQVTLKFRKETSWEFEISFLVDIKLQRI